MANQVFNVHKSNTPLLQMLVHNRPAPASMSSLQILQVVTLLVVLRLQCPCALDVLIHDGTASAAAVALCFLFLRFFRDSCMTVRGWKKERWLTPCLHLSSPLEKLCLAQLHSVEKHAQWCNRLVINNGIRWQLIVSSIFCCCCCCWLQWIIVGALKLFFLSCYRPMLNIQVHVVKRCWPRKELCSAFCSNIIAANSQRKIALNFKTLLLPAIRINLDYVIPFWMRHNNVWRLR